MYALLFVLLLVLLALEGLDFITTFSAAASCFNNVGPGMELVGPMSNYTCFSSFGKVLLAFSMLFGRLELYPMLLLFIPPRGANNGTRLPFRSAAGNLSGKPGCR